MKVYLMYQDCDFDLEQELPGNSQEIIKDLELDVLFKTMAEEDDYVLDVVKKALLSINTDREAVLYRQAILKDCLNNSNIVREIYDTAVEAIEKRRESHLGILSNTPSSILLGSINMLQMLMELLKKLREITDNHAHKFCSVGFEKFFAILKEELSEEFFNTADNQLQELRFDKGILISAGLGKGNEGTNYTVHKSMYSGFLDKIWSGITGSNPSGYSFKIHPRDISGYKAVSRIKDRALNSTADTVARAADHVRDFFWKLRTELAFYIGCLNLKEKLQEIDESVTFPQPLAAAERHLSFTGLYDPCLSLTMEAEVVGNKLSEDNKELIIITGANQGGKTTYLRSIGIAQLMMQAGMFVSARSFSANLCERLFTHFKREEDSEMERGKLDEELMRMDEIVNNLKSNSMILLNESFSSTTEREGSEIARQIVKALLEKNIEVFFVTHLYDFADYFYKQHKEKVIFLRAERKSDGRRTYKIKKGEPLQTSYGQDLYQKIFNHSD